MGSGDPNLGGVGANTVPVSVVFCPPLQAIWRLQRLRQVSCPHTPGVPPPPQVSPPLQPPQSTERPQPSPMVPQYLPVGWVQLVATQPGTPHTLAVTVPQA